MTARDSYIGWDLLSHTAGCRRPEWIVDTKTETDAWRGAGHECPKEECGHNERFDRTTVRIVCLSCARVHVIASEERVQPTPASHIGYGLPPRRLAGLLLWPGAPLLAGWDDNEPWSFIVTRLGVRRPTRDDLVGEIGQSRGSRNAVRYTAVAQLSDSGEYGLGQFRWAMGSETLRSVAAAAKWIAHVTAGAAEVSGEDR